MVKFKALTEEEALASGLLQPGIYDFEITAALDEISSSNNEMITLQLNVFDHDGSTRPIRAWLLPQMPKQWKHAHDACGLMEKYQSGESVAADFIGKTGKLQLSIGEPYKDKNGIERTSNKVEDYVKKDNLINDDSQSIPF